jgi:hypothetical protein
MFVNKEISPNGLTPSLPTVRRQSLASLHVVPAARSAMVIREKRAEI